MLECKRRKIGKTKSTHLLACHDEYDTHGSLKLKCQFVGNECGLLFSSLHYTGGIFVACFFFQIQWHTKFSTINVEAVVVEYDVVSGFLYRSFFSSLFWEQKIPSKKDLIANCNLQSFSTQFISTWYQFRFFFQPPTWMIK